MPSSPHESWRYFASKAAKENNSEELMKHVSHLLQLLGDQYPALTGPDRSRRLVAGNPPGKLDFADAARLTEFLLSAVIATDAKFGNVQVFDPLSGTLRIVAQHGFRSEFLTYFEVVRCDEASACGRALASRSRIVVENVLTDPIFEGQDSARVMLGANALSVQSTPLSGVSGEFLGVVSTHSDRPRTFSARELRCLDEVIAEFTA